MNTKEMPRSNLAKTITLLVSLVPRLQAYHKDEIKKIRVWLVIKWSDYFVNTMDHVHIIYACTTLDPGAYKESRENMGKQFMKEIKEKFRRKINIQQQRPPEKRDTATKIRDSGGG
jgi:hypothetical protein